jgi:transcriptional regulator with XRE-family HTH domain
MFNLLNMEKYDLKTLSGRIRWRMEQCEIARPAKLAGIAHVSRATVTLWLNGTTKKIEGPNLLKLSNALKCSPYWLQSGTGQWSDRIATAEDMRAYYEDTQQEMQVPVWQQGYDDQISKLIECFLALNDDHKLDLLAQAQAWAERDLANQDQQKSPRTKKRASGM